MMEGNKIMLSFKGEITSELMTSILQLMESKMENLNEQPKVRKKVYNVLVECLQNLYHHLDEVKPAENVSSSKSAIFMIGLGSDNYSIITGNYMLSEKVGALKGSLDKINSLDRSDLKELYKEVLKNEPVSEKGGGGLGMIDIARKTGQKLKYKFTDVNDKYSFFSLNINIAHNQS